MSKTKNCKSCNAEIATSAKVCPSCGAKNKKSIFKKWWFWLIIAVVLVGIIAVNGNSGNDEEKNATDNKPAKQQETIEFNGNSGNDEEKNATDNKPAKQQETIEYTSYDVTELFDALKDNALKAQNTYNGQYVELTGYLGTIDSNGKYIGLEANPDDMSYLLDSVHCTIKKGSGQLEQVMNLKKGEKITIRGKISRVGEVLGYSLDIDSIN